MLYPTVQEQKVVELAEELMVKVMGKYDPSHDAFHVKRVRNTAIVLARLQEPVPDLLVVEVAALLHDLFDKKYTKGPINTMEALEPFFLNVLEKSGIDLIKDGRAALIARVMENVSWTTESKLISEGKLEPWHESCIELHCVQDADRLDAIGAIGVMRCAAYSVTVNRPLHVPGEVSGESAIGHFDVKLLKIKYRLKTSAGKRMGEERHQFMLDFLEAIEKETNP
ncbi:hypothetical protein M422DRAFT_26099 [Sphaerobolus stellatus SS14]|nr:hypothetical protein M422DRAFT_26099 [Sphaerobolus stellatus SS14]